MTPEGRQAPGVPIDAREAPTPDDSFAVALRGFGPIGLLAIAVVLAGNFLFSPLSAILALIWGARSRTPWRELGFVRPESWIATIATGVLAGAAFKLLMKAIVMPLLGAPPVNPAYHFLVGNQAALPGMLLVVIVSAGFGEETFFRGYLFERLGKLLGSSVRAKAVIVVLTSLFFGLLHYHDQGLSGARQATISGLVFGTIFARTGRIWPLVIAHAAFDVTAVALIYGNLETRIASLFFR